MAEKDIEVREKQEVQTQAESTRNIPVYVPAVDIYESEEALTVVADMPGVAPENVDIDLRDDQLTIRGTVTVEGDGETVLLREYGVGDYYRQFTLGRIIDQSKIEAAMKDGVLTLTLPKVDKAKPRKITVKTG
ncbi:HSP20 family protein [Desulfacinum infernum DSM 9756]|jgi:HSP20 family protein|uniref:HSP20 family protein n=1 Tax=Desulfacinum infernum DSM 9756 TaxID=1121391 RepID=A0A1M5F1X3_9BACT|nr:Hsp20/alpha crystallin family protein [Desulfacinum infernum]MBZ4659556.1 Hsp20/alpha crystallin family protein [Desulfacinum sp.]SHF85533.1 HSP20 family protein [Desulfacinum infernum DSM 9756]